MLVLLVLLMIAALVATVGRRLCIHSGSPAEAWSNAAGEPLKKPFAHDFLAQYCIACTINKPLQGNIRARLYMLTGHVRCWPS